MREECILHMNQTSGKKTTLTCRYHKLEEEPIFVEEDIKVHTRLSQYTIFDRIIFVEKGNLLVQLGQFPEQILDELSIFLIPTGYNFYQHALTDVKIISIRLLQSVDFCECFATQSLINEKKANREYFPSSIKYESEIRLYLESIKKYVKEDLRCPGFSVIKIKELFFILGHNYPRRELFEFFNLYLSSDTNFSNLVYKLHSEVKNVTELAYALNYSLSGFQKHFKKVFGIPPSTWLSIQKSRMVYNDLLRNEPIKYICEKYNFSSLAHLNSFCNKFFGQNPRQIQKHKRLPDPIIF